MKRMFCENKRIQVHLYSFSIDRLRRKGFLRGLLKNDIYKSRFKLFFVSMEKSMLIIQYRIDFPLRECLDVEPLTELFKNL